MKIPMMFKSIVSRSAGDKVTAVIYHPMKACTQIYQQRIENGGMNVIDCIEHTHRLLYGSSEAA
jgi:hypothetical protein